VLVQAIVSAWQEMLKKRTAKLKKSKTQEIIFGFMEDARWFLNDG
jgi:hypothetical protein